VYKIQVNICRGTKCSTGEENNLDVIWTLVECSVKRVEHCTAITKTLTVLLPVMYVRNTEICEVDQRMHSGKLCVWLIIHQINVSVAIAIIFSVRTPWTLYTHVGMDACLCKSIVLNKQLVQYCYYPCVNHTLV